MAKLTQSKLDQIVKQTASKKWMHGAVFRIESLDDSISFKASAGNLADNDSFYIASINKLFIAAIVLRLAYQKKLSLSDTIAPFFSGEDLNGLSVFKGKDYSAEITIGQLLSHTSGLPCFLTDSIKNYPKVIEQLHAAADEEWPLEKIIAYVKKLKPAFYPGQKDKAHYSNTNFNLLGKVLEVLLEKPLDGILTDLFQETGLHNTYVIRDENKNHLPPAFFQDNPLLLPKFMSSSKYDIVSCSDDLMIFLKKFFSGYFFPADELLKETKWNNIFFPFQYGNGMQKLSVPRLFSPFHPIPPMIGHAGSTGTVAFYVPEKKIFITGAVNQIKNPATIFKAMIKILNQL